MRNIRIGNKNTDDAVGGGGLTPIVHTFLGFPLTGGKTRRQTLVGDGNQETEDDKFVVGKRTDDSDDDRGGEDYNLMSIDKDGNQRIAGGELVCTINNTTVDVFYKYIGPSLAVAVPRSEKVVMNNKPS